MSEYITQIVKQKEEEILKEVLRQCLGRDPELSDAKRLTRGIMEGIHDRYKLAFDNSYIGDVVYHFPNGIDKSEKFSIEFIPTI